MAALAISSADNDFGPFLAQDFDFTLLFEDAILSILPSCLLLLVAPFRALHLWRAPPKVKPSYHRLLKLGIFIILAILQLSNLIVWTLYPQLQTRASTATASLAFAATLTLCLLSDLDHMRCVRPSFVVGVYLLITIPLDAAKVRSLWLRSNSSVAGLATSILLMKILALIVEVPEKRGILLSPFSEYPPEAISGLYARGLFLWLNPIFLIGYKSVLTDQVLFRAADDLKSETLRKRFQRFWRTGTKVPRRYELILTTGKCVIRSFAAGLIPRLCQTFFRFMQPFLIKRVTVFVDQPESQYSTNQGWGLVAAYGLVYIGIAISTAMYNYRAYRTSTMVRGVLVTAVYSKTMELSTASLDESAAVTLMSTDVQRICEALALIHELWACPIDIALAVWLLEAEVGLAMFGPLIITLLSVSALLVMAPHIATAQKRWLGGVQARVNVTAKVLQTMKGVKMLGITSVISDMIVRLRESEIASSLKSRRLLAVSLLCGNLTDIFAPGVFFTIFVIVSIFNNQELTASSAYTTLSLIALLGSPVKVLINFAIPQLTAAVGCFDRIQTYLLLSPRHDYRLAAQPFQDIASETHSEIGLSEKHVQRQHTERERVVDEKVPESESKRYSIIQVKDCTLSWNDGGRPVINDVSFTVNAGLTMLTGPVGCGKSTLLKGLLGEVQLIKGQVFVDSLQIAFVDQTPWIQHGNLRENIIGALEFEHEFYSTVVHCCALDRDFDALSQGDLTAVGTAGAGLSGGQKLRVALARAVYSRRPILFLDDVFSGLDAASEERVFTRLLGAQGLLRKLNATVVLATHAIHRLSYADNIIAIDTAGTICEQGRFADLMASQGYIASLATRHKTETVDMPKEVVMLTRDIEDAESIAADDVNRPVGDLTVYKYYFAAAGYRRVALFYILMASYAFFLQFPALWVKFWTSAVADQGNHVNPKYLGLLLAFESLALLSLMWVVFHAYTVMVPRSAVQLHKSLLDSVRNAPLWFFTSTNIGQVVNRFSQDLNVVDFELPWAFFEFTACVYIALMQAILICLSAAYFTAIMPLVIGVMYLLQKFYLRTSRQIRLMDLEAKSPLYSNFLESLAGLMTIRAFGWISTFEKRNLTLLDDSQRPFYMLFCIQRWLNLVLDLTVAGLAVLLMIFIVTLREKLQAGLVGVALLNIMNFNLSLNEVIKQYTTLETSLGAIARIKEFVQTMVSENLPQENQEVPPEWPSKGAIDISDMSASYTAGGPLVLNNIDLYIPAGQKLGVVGRSGSGKSSLVTTLFRMLEIACGSITIDHVDIATIPRQRVREKLNVIPQEPLFLSGSARMNLDPLSRSKSDDDLISALGKVGLWTIVLNAGGLDVSLDADTLFSHGQRQLFCLARAIVNRSESSVLILDEATANVDIQTDEIMQRIIRNEFKECTIIAVAHRLETIKDFDRIIVLDEGCIVEEGNPEALLEDEHSRFRQLWDS